MRSPAAFLPVLLAVALSAWLLLAGGEDQDPTPVRPPVERETRPAPAPEVPAPPAPAPAPASVEAPPPPPPPPPEPARPPRESLTAEEVKNLPRGGVVVQVTDPAGDLLPIDAVTVRAEPIGTRDFARRLPLRDPERREHRFEDLLVGRVRVLVGGEGFRDEVVEADVVDGEPQKVVVQLRRGASLEYRVVGDIDDLARRAKVSLLDRSRREAEVWGRMSDGGSSTPHRGTALELGPKGRLWGFAPGRYILRLTVPGKDALEQEFVAETERPADLTFTLPR